jgi:hypothetical protein
MVSFPVPLCFPALQVIAHILLTRSYRCIDLEAWNGGAKQGAEPFFHERYDELLVILLY